MEATKEVESQQNVCQVEIWTTIEKWDEFKKNFF